MGNPRRCPKCNGLGSKLKDNICRRCDSDMFLDKVYTACNSSHDILNRALLEVNAKTVYDVRREDRARLINIIQRRTRRVTRHIESDHSILENPNDVGEGLSYGLEKGAPSIESLE